MLVEYAALDYLAITEILKIIAKEEKITYDETAIKIIRGAIELDVNFIDTANVSSGGR